MKNKNSIYAFAIKSYGKDMQKIVACEELSELQKEICKSFRGHDNRPALIEEIADVEIMLEQLKLMYGCLDEVSVMKHKKLNRLSGRLGMED